MSGANDQAGTAGGETPASGGLLAGKVAIITGASRGIGAAAARVFAREGAAVVLAARSEGAIAALAGEIAEAGGRAIAVPTDVGEPEAMRRLVERTVETFGRLDAAFNNAGDGHPKLPLAEIALADFDRSIRTNLRGIFLALKYEIPAMLAGGGGAIVNMSSTAGLSGVQGMSGYVAGKHGIAGLTKSAALDYAAQGIRVNAVAPGPILTERLSSLPEEYRAPVIAAVPMRRIGAPEEVGALAAWLCSDRASFLTGAVIPIDGGRMAAGA
jgi:NAD(P)-dependent dehydrogenase (short-subunit alcohol dehydrogenase family)